MTLTISHYNHILHMQISNGLCVYAVCVCVIYCTNHEAIIIIISESLMRHMYWFRTHQQNTHLLTHSLNCSALFDLFIFLFCMSWSWSWSWAVAACCGCCFFCFPIFRLFSPVQSSSVQIFIIMPIDIENCKIHVTANSMHGVLWARDTT